MSNVYRFQKIKQFEFDEIEWHHDEKSIQKWEYFLNRYNYKYEIRQHYIKLFEFDYPLESFLCSQFFAYNDVSGWRIPMTRSVNFGGNIFYDIKPYRINSYSVVFTFSKTDAPMVIRLPENLFTMD